MWRRDMTARRAQGVWNLRAHARYTHKTRVHRRNLCASPLALRAAAPSRSQRGLCNAWEGLMRGDREESWGGVGEGPGNEGCGPPLCCALTSPRAGRPAALHSSARVWEMASHISIRRDRTRPGGRRAGKTRKEGRDQEASCLLGGGATQLQSSIFLREAPRCVGGRICGHPAYEDGISWNRSSGRRRFFTFATFEAFQRVSDDPPRDSAELLGRVRRCYTTHLSASVTFSERL